jgi:hypothetical protein
MPYATNSILLGSGVAANRKDVNVYPNFFLFRKLPMVSRLDSCSLPINRRKKLLRFFKMSLPIVAPVAPTSANRRGSSELSRAKKDESTIQVGGIKIGAAFIPINKRNIPK